MKIHIEKEIDISNLVDEFVKTINDFDVFYQNDIHSYDLSPQMLADILANMADEAQIRADHADD